MRAKIKRRLGLFLIIAPWVLLPIVLALYAITTFILVQSETELLGSVISFILGLLGVVSIIGIFIGLPVGIFLMSRTGADPAEVEVLKHHVGYGHLSDEHLAFLSQWSLGAFLNPVVWAIGNKLYFWAVVILIPTFIIPVLWIFLTFVGLIPTVLLSFLILGFCLFALIYLIVRGRRLAWKKGWSSFEQFQKRQSFLLRLILTLAAVAFLISAIVGVVGALRGNGDVKVNVTVSEKEIFDGICSRLEDVDQDYLTAFDEKKFNTNPNSADTDGDGYDDLSELLGGYDAGTFDPSVIAVKFTGRGNNPDEIRENWLIDYQKKAEGCKK